MRKDEQIKQDASKGDKMPCTCLKTQHVQLMLKLYPVQFGIHILGQFLTIQGSSRFVTRDVSHLDNQNQFG